MKTTKHSKKRIKERLGLSKNLTDKLAKKALEEGITHKETTGRLNKYIAGLYFYNKKANNIRIYNQKVYIFYNQKLITVHDLPTNLKKIEQDILKKRNL